MATTHLRVSAEDRRQQIIDAATGLFARQGFEGTTTRQIAEKAGINEAIIFRHFPTKEDLYWAIIEQQCRMRGARERLARRLSSGLDDLEVFTSIAEDILSRDTTLTRLLLFSALERHELSERFFRTHVASLYELLADYIRQGIAEGRFRNIDPVLAARAFIGMSIYQYQIQELFGDKNVHNFDCKHVSRTFAQIWLDGMRPRVAEFHGPHSDGHKEVPEKVR